MGEGTITCRTSRGNRGYLGRTIIHAIVTIFTSSLNFPISQALLSSSPTGCFSGSLRSPNYDTGSSQFHQLSTLNQPTRQITCTQKNPFVLHYADEWMDAHVELAFSSPTSTKRNPVSSPRSRRLKLSLSRLFNNLYQHISKIKSAIRLLVEKGTIYVLECENGKYYVGSTKNRRKRLREHNRRRGCKWTREHKPIRVLREYRRIPLKYLLGMESRVTAELMLEFGVNNVRGSMFCSPREYHLGDIDALTKFLGHYNDLSYRKVQQRLSQTLPLSPHQMRKRSNVKCFNCGETGHYSFECPERENINP
mmetsp:Transcript_14088/g.29622  ORF Transcript_14088/g.29622 Transcript_14088/m.29622 type:complete len:308 (-) Transcript_14088:293-1216(-)